MRNWNQKVIFLSKLSIYLWILPMRNWNALRLTVVSLLNPFEYYLWGIETLPVPFFFRFNSVPLNTTYEELKPICNILILLKSFTLNTTYEELKLKNYMQPRFFKLIFEYYLWGIETIFKFVFNSLKWSLNTTYEELKHS